ncbi:MAG: hypothetical protein RMY34_05710 [Aulosira sp. DedQUE10]|nr:hypothetical protein [Aulosira sp. DedQUE10]
MPKNSVGFSVYHLRHLFGRTTFLLSLRSAQEGSLSCEDKLQILSLGDRTQYCLKIGIGNNKHIAISNVFKLT